MRVLFTLLFAINLLYADRVIKVTLNKFDTTFAVSSIDKILFYNGRVNMGELYKINAIQKIEIYNDSTVSVKGVSTKALEPQIVINGRDLKVNVPQNRESCDLLIFDIKGREVSRLKAKSNSPFSLKKLAAGVYTVVLKSENVIYSKKMVVR